MVNEKLKLKHWIELIFIVSGIFLSVLLLSLVIIYITMFNNNQFDFVSTVFIILSFISYLFFDGFYLLNIYKNLNNNVVYLPFWFYFIPKKTKNKILSETFYKIIDDKIITTNKNNGK